MALSHQSHHGWPYSSDAAPRPSSQAPAASAPSMAPASSPLEAREGPSPQQWQAVKEEIRVLYERRPLKDVRRILEQRFGFRATERMYKARLSLWGFNKNYSDRDYQVCAVIHYSRQRSGKRHTAFRVHGHERTVRDLHKYIKGRKMSEEEFLAIALKNIDCNNAAEEYAHVRAFTPEADDQANDDGQAQAGGERSRQQSGSQVRDTTPPKLSPAPAASGSPVPSLPGFSPVNSRPKLPPAPYFPQSSSQLSPPPLQPLDAQAPQQEGVTLDWQARSGQSSLFASSFSTQPRRSHEVPPAAFPSPREQLSDIKHPQRYGDGFGDPYQAYSASRSESASHAESSARVYLTNQVSSPVASFSPSRTGPPSSCQHLSRSVEYMALSVVGGASPRSLTGSDDNTSWRLMSSTSSISSCDDFEKICPSCAQSTNSHFISLPNLEMGASSPRNLLNETSGSTERMSIPSSTRGHDHSWKWAARCFCACIYLCRGSEEFSRHSLADAKQEFEAMLHPTQDPKVIIVLNQTMSILHSHDQAAVTKAIISSAHEVAQRVLGDDDPVTTTVRWMTYVADLTMRDRDITSSTLKTIHSIFVERHGYADPRSIASLYNYGYMLNVERQLSEAESVLREVYDISCRVLSPKHLQSTSALVNLHRCLERQGRLAEAIEVLERATKDCRETLGRNHPRRAENKRLLAVLYGRIDPEKHADTIESLYWDSLEGKLKMLGRNHKFTQAMKRDLERLLKRRGKWGEDDSPSEAQHKLHDMFEWDDGERWESGSDMGNQTNAY